MSTKRHAPPFRRPLLLLSAFTLVTCSKVFAASSVANGHPDQASEMHPTTVVSNQERGLDTNKEKVKTMEDRSATVDILFRDMIDLTDPHVFYTPQFEIVASNIIHADDDRKVGLTALFGGIVRADQANDNNKKFAGLGELVRQIVFLKENTDLPIPETTFKLGTLAFENMINLNWRYRIMMDLEGHLLEYLKTKSLTPDEFYGLLKVDAKSSAFLKDPSVLPRIEYLSLYTHWTKESVFELILNKFQKSHNNFEITTELLAAGAKTEPGSVGEQLMIALFRDWHKKKVELKALLFELVPFLEGEDILNGPLILWIEYSKEILKQDLYPTLLATLFHPYDSVPLPGGTFGRFRNRDKELALVDIIVREWDKFFAARPSSTPLPGLSPLAKPIFQELCTHWEKNEMSLNHLYNFFQLNRQDGSLPKRGRRWAWVVFAVFSDPDIRSPLLKSNIYMTEMAEIVALLVDLDEGVSWRISEPYFRNLKSTKVNERQLFDELKLDLSDDRPYQNRLLTIWYLYSLYSRVDLGKVVLTMRKEFQGVRSDSKFESLLEESVRATDGKLQQVLFKLMAIRCIREGMKVKDLPFSHLLESPKMKGWYEELRQQYLRSKHLVKRKQLAISAIKKKLLSLRSISSDTV